MVPFDQREGVIWFNGEFVPGNQWVSPEHPYFQKSVPVLNTLSRSASLRP